jgi:two-component system response regulator VicR
MKILVAEDEATLLEMIAFDLEEQGASVMRAKDGEEAIQMMNKQQPDLLLLDLLMPKKDGFDVLKYVRKKGYAFPVVIISNLSAPLEERLCRDLGAKDYLIKSQFDTGDLWERVKKYLKQEAPLK